MFDELHTLQLQIKAEAELVLMYGRLFEDQIKNKFSQDNHKYVSEVLRHRSDLEYFKFEDELSNIVDAIKREQKSSGASPELDMLIKEKG